MVDVLKFITSIKSCWEKIIDQNNDEDWYIFYSNILQRVGGELAFECYSDEYYVDTLCKNNTF